MKKTITFILTSASLIIANTAFGQAGHTPYYFETVNCTEAANGVATRAANSNSHRTHEDVPGMHVRTRSGNNGSGNGGEALLVYQQFIAQTWVTVRLECIDTDGEDSGGGVWRDIDADGIYDFFLPGTLEFDPKG